MLITGASSGIGRSIAILLSNTYNLIICGRRDEKLKETLSLCVPGNHHIGVFDLSDVTCLEQDLSSFLSSINITVSYFVHSAGFMKLLPLRAINADVFNVAFNTNVISAAIITKILTGKRTNKSSLKSVVFISSNISNMGAKAFSSYGASKAALDGLMRCLAMELAPKVRINSVLPGGVKTEMTATMFNDEELVKRMENTYPLGLGYTDDIANAVEFLLSDKARWITGQQLTVDGGRTVNVTA
ncbi:MAG: SDR family oxidoreductase [Longicatena sp.]